MLKNICIIIVLLISITVSYSESIYFGRSDQSRKGIEFGFRAGAITKLETVLTSGNNGGLIKYGLPNNKGDTDFDVNKPYPTVGLSFIRFGRLFSFLFGINYARIDNNGTASQDYVLNVSSVDYNGQKYKYMFIESGKDFSFKSDGVIFETRIQFNPVTISHDDYFYFVPYLDFGINGMAYRYKVNSGDPSSLLSFAGNGVVDGGSASGDSGIVFPDYGIGIEIGLGRHDRKRLIFNGRYSILKYNGTPDFLNNNDSYDLDHYGVNLNLNLEVPTKRENVFFVGCEYKRVDFNSERTRPDSTKDDLLFKIDMINFILGFRF